MHRLLLHSLLSCYRAIILLGAAALYCPSTVFAAFRDRRRLHDAARTEGRSLGLRLRWLLFYPIRCHARFLFRLPELTGWTAHAEWRRAVRDATRAFLMWHQETQSNQGALPRSELARRLHSVLWGSLIYRLTGLYRFADPMAEGASTLSTWANAARRFLDALPKYPWTGKSTGDASLGLRRFEVVARQCEILGLDWQPRRQIAACNIEALKVVLETQEAAARPTVRFQEQILHPRRVLTRLQTSRMHYPNSASDSASAGDDSNETFRNILDRERLNYREAIAARLQLPVSAVRY